MTFPLFLDLLIVLLLIVSIIYGIMLNIKLRRLRNAIQEMIPSFQELRDSMSQHEEKTRAMLDSLEYFSNGALKGETEDITPNSFYSLVKKGS